MHRVNVKSVLFWLFGGILVIVCAFMILQHTGVAVSGAKQDMLDGVQYTQDKALDKYKLLAYMSQKDIIKDQKAREKALAEQSAKNVAENTLEADTAGSGNAYLTQDTYGAPVYMIQRGDTLSGISAKVLYSVDELAEYNKIKDVNLIYADSALRVPNEE